MELVLHGTERELSSTRAKKVLVTASYAGLKISIRCHQSTQEVQQAACCESTIKTPLVRSLALTYKMGTQYTTTVPTTQTMMRSLAMLAPAYQLTGTTDLQAAQVDSWMMWIWSSIEMPFSAVLETGQADSASASDDIPSSLIQSLEKAFGIVDRHLKENTHLVDDGITLADISLVVALANAARIWNDDRIEKHPNLGRLYSELTQQDWFQRT